MTGKQDKLTAGDGIKISDEGVISSSGGEVVLTNENNKLKVQVGENSDTVDVITRYNMTTNYETGNKLLYVNNNCVNIGGYDYFHVWQGDLKDLFRSGVAYYSSTGYPCAWPITDVMVQVAYGSTSTSSSTINACGLIPLYGMDDTLETQDISPIGSPDATGTRLYCMGGIYLDTYYTVLASINRTSTTASLNNVYVRRGSTNLSKLTNNYISSTGGGYRVFVRDSFVKNKYGEVLTGGMTGLDTNGKVELDCGWGVDTSKASSMTFRVRYSRWLYDDETFEKDVYETLSYTDFNKMISGTGYTFTDVDATKAGYGTLRVTVGWGDIDPLSEYSLTIYSSADSGGATDDNDWNLNRLSVNYELSPGAKATITGITGSTPTVSTIRIECATGEYYVDLTVADNSPNATYTTSPVLGSILGTGNEDNGRVFKLLDSDGNVIAQKTDFAYTR